MRIKKRSVLDSSGLLLVEILLAVALMGMITLIILSAFLYGQESTAIAGDRLHAAQIANQSVAAIHNIAQDSYDNLNSYSDGTTYYLDDTADEWTLVTSVTTIDDIYTPEVVFGQGPDGSRQVIITVSWPQVRARPNIVTLTTYFTDWQTTTFGPSAADLASTRRV